MSRFSDNTNFIQPNKGRYDGHFSYQFQEGTFRLGGIDVPNKAEALVRLGVMPHNNSLINTVINALGGRVLEILRDAPDPARPRETEGLICQTIADEAEWLASWVMVDILSVLKPLEQLTSSVDVADDEKKSIDSNVKNNLEALKNKFSFYFMRQLGDCHFVSELDCQLSAMIFKVIDQLRDFDNSRDHQICHRNLLRSLMNDFEILQADISIKQRGLMNLFSIANTTNTEATQKAYYAIQNHVYSAEGVSLAQLWIAEAEVSGFDSISDVDSDADFVSSVPRENRSLFLRQVASLTKTSVEDQDVQSWMTEVKIPDVDSTISDSAVIFPALHSPIKVLDTANYPSIRQEDVLFAACLIEANCNINTAQQNEITAREKIETQHTALKEKIDATRVSWWGRLGLFRDTAVTEAMDEPLENKGGLWSWWDDFKNWFITRDYDNQNAKIKEIIENDMKKNAPEKNEPDIASVLGQQSNSASASAQAFAPAQPAYVYKPGDLLSATTTLVYECGEYVTREMGAKHPGVPIAGLANRMEASYFLRQDREKEDQAAIAYFIHLNEQYHVDTFKLPKGEEKRKYNKAKLILEENIAEHPHTKKLFDINFLNQVDVRQLSKPPLLVRGVISAAKVIGGVILLVVQAPIAMLYFLGRELFYSANPVPDAPISQYFYKNGAKILLGAGKVILGVGYIAKFIIQSAFGFTGRVLSGVSEVLKTLFYKAPVEFWHQKSLPDAMKYVFVKQIGVKLIGGILASVGELVGKAMVIATSPLLALCAGASSLFSYCTRNNKQESFFKHVKEEFSAFFATPWKAFSQLRNGIKDTVIELEKNDSPHFHAENDEPEAPIWTRMKNFISQPVIAIKNAVGRVAAFAREHTIRVLENRLQEVALKQEMSRRKQFEIKKDTVAPVENSLKPTSLSHSTENSLQNSVREDGSAAEVSSKAEIADIGLNNNAASDDGVRPNADSSLADHSNQLGLRCVEGGESHSAKNLVVSSVGVHCEAAKSSVVPIAVPDLDFQNKLKNYCKRSEGYSLDSFRDPADWESTRQLAGSPALFSAPHSSAAACATEAVTPQRDDLTLMLTTS